MANNQEKSYTNSKFSYMKLLHSRHYWLLPISQLTVDNINLHPIIEEPDHPQLLNRSQSLEKEHQVPIELQPRRR